MLSASSRNRSPFTPNQWQELEQQALVFKYMVTGTPVPPDLIYSIKRSLDTSISSRIFPHPPIGWGCFEMGFGRKVDPEPGRCRRTDGKKWRCSKEAYPDSKYCERHMHRGRNRSRKPVEQQLVVSSTNTTSLTNTTSSSSSPYTNRNISLNNNNSNLTSSFPFSTSMTCHDQSQQQQQPFSQSYQNSSLNPYFYSQQSNSSKPLDHSDFQSQDATTHHLFLDSSSYSHDDKDYRRQVHGIRDGVDERTFFPEATGSSRSYHQYGSYNEQLQVNPFKSYSSSQQFQNINDNTRQQEQQQEQHCFVLGTDFKSTRPTNKDKESETTQKPLHHFFGEWTPKNTDSWLDLASNSRIPTDE
ncbi:growth-regulating factor 5-like isoform X1 [Trifolium pratense]|uniref:growth-regulating factor 5-like isoform X1 n=1 Tax=Trifolium pratense TaxID=57577 RepID=UPI001E6946F2|nr:growth-regulating factor 5-like isoform X1 [Trifolium pratense]